MSTEERGVRKLLPRENRILREERAILKTIQARLSPVAPETPFYHV